MNFSAWAIKNPVAPLLAFFMLMVLGFYAVGAVRRAVDTRVFSLIYARLAATLTALRHVGLKRCDYRIGLSLGDGASVDEWLEGLVEAN